MLDYFVFCKQAVLVLEHRDRDLRLVLRHPGRDRDRGPRVIVLGVVPVEVLVPAVAKQVVVRVGEGDCVPVARAKEQIPVDLLSHLRPPQFAQVV